MKIFKFLFKVFIVLAVVVLLILGVITGLLYHYQDKIIFNKSRFPLGKTFEVRENYEEVTLVTSEGYRYKCWFVKAAQTEGGPTPATVIYYLGNGSYKESYRGTYNLFTDLIQVNIFSCSNRGSGDYEGEPNEQKLYEDAQLYYDYIVERVGTGSLFGHGRSMGGATVTETVSNNQESFSGLTLENTFLSIPKISKDFHPFLYYFMLGFKYLLITKMDNESKVKNLTLPTQFLISEMDKTVNPRHMYALYEASGSKRKYKFVNPKGTHDDVALDMIDEFVEAYSRFVNENRKDRQGVHPAKPSPVPASEDESILSSTEASSSRSLEGSDIETASVEEKEVNPEQVERKSLRS